MEYEQMLLWVEWEPRRELPTGGTFKTAQLAFEPDRVWTMFRHISKGSPPLLPVDPVHRQNAFLEDRGHDWNYRQGKFRYYSRVIGQSCWLLIEYKNKARPTT